METNSTLQFAEGRLLRVLITCVTLVLLTGCDRSIDQPDCGSTIQPQDYGRFIVDGSDGLARHISGTVWYRCAAGQSFRGKKCLGESLALTRSEADAYVREFSEKSGEIWRLPTRDEFEQITENSCDNPAANPNVFPGLAVVNYWTADSSWHGDRFGCSIYMYKGSTYCRQASQIEQPILMVKD